jgi:hypothetical protein
MQQYKLRELQKRMTVLEQTLDPDNLPQLCIVIKQNEGSQVSMEKTVCRFPDGVPYGISGVIRVPVDYSEAMLCVLQKRWDGMEAV